MVFAGLEPSYEDYEEKRLIEELWDFYWSERVRYNLNTNIDVFFFLLELVRVMHVDKFELLKSV